jgi:ATP-dependent protease HslVU (ClpYQ) ATPase subunit
MDILAIKPNTIIVQIQHPASSEPIGLQIECVSLEDDRVKAVERAIKNKALRGGRNSMTAEKIEDNTVDLLAAAIVGWHWDDGLSLGDLKNPPLTKVNIVKLLEVGWVAKQVDSALGDEAAFFAK